MKRTEVVLKIFKFYIKLQYTKLHILLLQSTINKIPDFRNVSQHFVRNHSENGEGLLALLSQFRNKWSEEYQIFEKSKRKEEKEKRERKGRQKGSQKGEKERESRE